MPKLDEMYADILKTQLAKRLKRDPSDAELINADNDSDLVNETLWQLVCNLGNRIVALEQKAKITKPSTSVIADDTLS